MTEQDWLASADPEAMLTWLGSRISNRKFRMLGAALLLGKE